MLTKLFLCASMLLTAGGAPAADQKPQPKPEQKVAKKADQKVEKRVDKKAEQKAEPKADGAAEADPQSPMPREMLEKKVDGVKLAAIEVNLVSYTNEQRVANGLPPFEVDKELMETAREQAAWMSQAQSMTHTQRPLAENIAMGQPHSSDAVESWMNSPGHRANILNPGHRRIGVAAFRTVSGVIYWCQQFGG